MKFSLNSNWENHPRTLLGNLAIPPKLLSLIKSLLSSLFFPLLLPCLQFSFSFWLLFYHLYVLCFSPLWWKMNTNQRTLILPWGNRGIEDKFLCSIFILFLFCFSFPQLSFIPIPFFLLFSSSIHPLSYCLFSGFVTDFWQSNLLQVSGN